MKKSNTLILTIVVLSGLIITMLIPGCTSFQQVRFPRNNTPEIFYINRLPAHTTLMPYADVDAALEGNRSASPYFYFLN